MNRTVFLSYRNLREIKTQGIMFAHLQCATWMQRHAAFLIKNIF